VIVLPDRDRLEAQIFGMPWKGGNVQLAGGGAPPFLRSAHLQYWSSVILVTVPALTGAEAIAAER